jgi:hypothetical protein
MRLHLDGALRASVRHLGCRRHTGRRARPRATLARDTAARHTRRQLLDRRQATKKGAPADYDAFLGFWQFRFQSRNADGSFNAAFPGHWSFEKKPGGLLIEDRWRADNSSQPMGVRTYTYRTFHPQRNVWQMLGTSSLGGEFALGLTWSDDTNRYAIQHYGSAIMRIRYLSIRADKFLWRADRSTDGGRTWLLDAWTMEATRVGR